MSDTRDESMTTREALDHTLAAFGRLEAKHYERGRALSACEERLGEAERALRQIVARLTAADGESVARGHAAAFMAREIARDALHAGEELEKEIERAQEA